jgi:ribosomal protein S18 acetylase RimI-like enzyme
VIQPPAERDTDALVALACATGLFTPPEADALLRRTLEGFHAGALGEGHEVLVRRADGGGAALGWAYFSPDPHADGVWELWWIGVDPAQHRRGVGAELLREVELRVARAGGRLLMIATSSLPPLAAARSFYARHGYARCGQIPDYYGRGDDKVLFAKAMA